MRQRPKTLKSNVISRGHYQTRVHSDQIVLVIGRREAELPEWWPKVLEQESENDSRQPRDLLKTGIVTAKKKNSKLTLSQGMLKKGNDDDDEVDYEVRTTVLSQNSATETLSIEEFLLRTQYL